MNENELNQLKFTNFMKDYLKENLLGTGVNYITGYKPLSLIYGGVIFPNSIFKDANEQINHDEMDPDVKFVSISKNINFGLEFLINNSNLPENILISGEFSIFIRIKPNYLDHVKSLSFLKDSEQPNENTLTDKLSKGLTLVEKYKKFTFKFSDLKLVQQKNNFIIDNDSYTKLYEDFHAFNMTILNDSELLNPNIQYINKVGSIDIPKIFENEMEYSSFLNSIHGSENLVPNYNFEIKIDTLDYIRKPNCQKVLVTLTNSSSSNFKGKSFHPLELFDCSISISIPRANHIPFEFEGVRKNYLLDSNYLAKGQNCTAVTEEMGNSLIFKSEFMPTYFQKLYRTREDLTVKFEDLIEDTKTIQTLQNISSNMRNYSIEWQKFIRNSGDSDFKLKSQEDIEQCEKLLQEFEEEISSFELGIYALTKDTKLLEAFNLTNRVFIDSSKGKYDGWRLFQIIFIVRMFPSLYCREMPDNEIRKDEIILSTEYADVLWFPTGGGKTEAYLGTILTALFYDRLRGKARGVTA